MFLKNIDRLSRLPLMTDREMEDAFGAEVVAAITRLDNYNFEKKLCSKCSNRCCLVARCELYSPEFSSCPIHEMRPLVCRMHFCRQFQPDCKQLVDDISDIFFECLMTADCLGNPEVRLFDAPPLTMTAPGFVEKTAPLVKSVKEGKMPPRQAMELIQREAENYRPLQ